MTERKARANIEVYPLRLAQGDDKVGWVQSADAVLALCDRTQHLGRCAASGRLRLSNCGSLRYGRRSAAAGRDDKLLLSQARNSFFAPLRMTSFISKQASSLSEIIEDIFTRILSAQSTDFTGEDCAKIAG
jgi:hypothetical protein